MGQRTDPQVLDVSVEDKDRVHKHHGWRGGLGVANVQICPFNYVDRADRPSTVQLVEGRK